MVENRSNCRRKVVGVFQIGLQGHLLLAAGSEDAEIRDLQVVGKGSQNEEEACWVGEGGVAPLPPLGCDGGCGAFDVQMGIP